MPIHLFELASEKNISELEIDAWIRSAKLVESYKKNLRESKQKNIQQGDYGIIFEAFVWKYLPRKSPRMYFKNRTDFRTNKTFNKFLLGKYKIISRIDTRLILKVCLGLLMTKEESYTFFYVCGQGLWRSDDKYMVEKEILEQFEDIENLDELSEVDKAYEASERIYLADKILRKNGRKSIYENVKD